MSEGALQRQIQLAISRETDATLWRNQVGTGWYGKLLSHRGDHVLLEHARPLSAGLCVGSSDLIGLARITITPDMVGRTVAVFTGLEVKAPRGRERPEQATFRAHVEQAGGIAAVVRSPDDAVSAVKLYRGRKA